ncbi:MAG TPA: aromatic amino acid transport family protein [Chlamydiales bacterium]|nr:MAG: hypothetical protein A3F67_00300 [Verrucomicrobia bacterium RIFCSPHIGHO2_12_FULL_41_10]HLB53078.1 aromatic amino acid transport family protein [Chlamydiales bacterium]
MTSRNKNLVPGSLFGGMLLVVGCCIGAGMLALPVLIGLAGFFPSLLMLIAAWAFMTYTGCLLIEVNGWFEGPVNLLSMVKEGLGKTAYGIAWATYLLLFYSLLVAYVSASGAIFSSILQALFHIQISDQMASLIFTLLLGWIIYLGTGTVDLVNRFLMIGLITAYVALIAVGIMKVEPHNLAHIHFGKLFLSLPVLVVSFGFQNLVPSLITYMREDLQRVKHAIVGGSFIVLIIYLLWCLVILGVVPPEQLADYYNQGKEATSALTSTTSPFLINSSRLFAFFAIITSFLPIGLTLAHFLADGFHVIPTRQKMRWLVLLTIVPPLLLGLFYPTFFFKALSFAGGICAMILFGIFPVAMAWIGRYKKGETSNYHVGGGKFALVIAFLFASFVLICELVRVF